MENNADWIEHDPLYKQHELNTMLEHNPMQYIECNAYNAMRIIYNI